MEQVDDSSRHRWVLSTSSFFSDSVRVPFIRILIGSIGVLWQLSIV